jgi:hypothetical protein
MRGVVVCACRCDAVCVIKKCCDVGSAGAVLCRARSRAVSGESEAAPRGKTPGADA